MQITFIGQGHYKQKGGAKAPPQAILKELKMATKVTYEWVLATVMEAKNMEEEKWGYQKEVLNADGGLIAGGDAIYSDSLHRIMSDMGTGLITFPIGGCRMQIWDTKNRKTVWVQAWDTYRLVLKRTQTTDIPYSWKGEQRERVLYAHVDEYGKLDDFFQKDQFGNMETKIENNFYGRHKVHISGHKVPQKFHKELAANKEAQKFGDFGKSFKRTHGQVHSFMSGQRHCRRCEGLMQTSPFLASDEAPKMEIKSLKSQPYNSRLGTRYAMVANCTNSQCDNKEYIQDPQEHWNRGNRYSGCLTCVK